MIDEVSKEYDLLYTFDSNNTNNSYMICTDNTYNDDGKLKITAFIYFPKDKEKGVEPIKEDKDWVEVEKFLSVMENDYNE